MKCSAVERPVTHMARKRAPHLMAQRPSCEVEGLVFDALVGLPNPPTLPLIAHWTDLTQYQVRKALERLRRRGRLGTAGTIPRYPSGHYQTYTWG